MTKKKKTQKNEQNMETKIGETHALSKRNYNNLQFCWPVTA